MNKFTDPLPAIMAELTAEKAPFRSFDKTKMPATQAMLDDAREAIGRSIPDRFEHQGRTFFLRVSVGMARLEVFDNPDSADKLCMSLYGSYKSHGHRPES